MIGGALQTGVMHNFLFMVTHRATYLIDVTMMPACVQETFARVTYSNITYIIDHPRLLCLTLHSKKLAKIKNEE